MAVLGVHVGVLGVLRALGALVLLGAAAPAWGGLRAEPHYRVVLLKPPVTDEITTDAVARVRGELTAAGFDVREIAQDPTLDVRDALETSSRELDPIATFAIIRGAPGSPGASLAEIWVCDRIAGKSVIQNVRLDREASEPDRGAAVLAVQAVELLKASLAQYWMAPLGTPVAARAAVHPASSAPAETPESFVTTGVSVQAGVGWLDSLGAVGPVWEPILRASYGGREGWAGRISVSGLGAETELRATPGTAQITQGLGTFELLRMFRRGGRIQLFASAGTGAYHLRVRGSGIMPSTGTDHADWSLLGIAGGGLAVAVAPHVALLAEAQGLVTWPYSTVRINFVPAGRTGWPSSLLSAGLLGTF